MLIITAVTIVYLICLSEQTCLKGCLKCIKGKCVQCDWASGYKEIDGRCRIYTVQQCEEYGRDGGCQKCPDGYYLEKDTLNCIRTQRTMAQINCIEYFSDGTCKSCSAYSFRQQSVCKSVPQIIKNCEYYISAKRCRRCYVGYIFEHTETECMLQPPYQSCIAFTYNYCSKCKSGYRYDKNKYFKMIFESGKAILDFEILRERSAQYPQIIDSPVCEPIVYNYCKIDQKGENCIYCPDGQYLSIYNECIQNPTQSVENCYVYKSLTKCSECQQGYYLLDEHNCRPVVKIKHCSQYDTKSYQTLCKECVKEYYINQTNCQRRKRLDQIGRCSKYNTHGDNCQECDDGFFVSLDRLACFEKIENCNKHNDMFSFNVGVVCSQCQGGYFLQDNECVEGLIQNCQIYDSSGFCQKCINQYFLNSNKCYQHANIPQCEIYDDYDRNKCTSCENGYFPFGMSKVCDVGVEISNCLIYSEDYQTCQECQQRHYLAEDSTCKKFTEGDHCLSYDTEGKCAKCEPQYVLYLDQTCIEPLDYVTSNCRIYDLTNKTINGIIDYAVCSDCSSYAAPHLIKNMAICVETTRLSYFNISSLVTDCEKYSNDSEPRCLQCKTGKVLDPLTDTDVHTCVSSCPIVTLQTVLVLNNLNGQVNVCQLLTSFSSSCLIAVRVSLYNTNTGGGDINLDYRCIKFVSTYYLVHPMTYGQYNDVGHGYQDLETNTTPLQLQYNGYKTVADLKTGGSFVFNTNSITNCELFYQTIIQGVNSYGCYRCEFGDYRLQNDFNNQTTCVSFSTNCDNQIKVTGLPSYINALASCHVCARNTYTVNSVKYFKGGSYVYFRLVYGSAAGNPFTGFQIPASETQFVTDCVVVDIANAEYIADCLIYAHIVDEDGNNGKQVCLSCQMGYKATYLAAGVGANWAITACTKIDNCQDPYTMANACGQCQNMDLYGSYQFYAFSDESQQQCIKTNGPNCLIDDGTGKCELCREGYFIDGDGLCEYMKLPFCDKISSGDYALSYANDANDEISQKKVRRYYMQNRTGAFHGCQECENDYTLVYTSAQGINLCLPFSNLLHYPVYGTTSNYVTNCIGYKVEADGNGHFLCTLCREGYLPASDYLSCQLAIENCLLVQNGACFKCKSGYLQTNKKCMLPDIENCIEYDETVISDTQICKTCQEGFSLNFLGNLCLQGEIDYCATYAKGSTTSCLSCSNYYFLVQGYHGPYCYPIQEEYNCYDLDKDYKSGGRAAFKCSQCKASLSTLYVLKQWTEINLYADKPQTICLPFKKISNCAQYDQNQPNIDNNSFLCLKCEDGFYLTDDKKVCVQHNRKVPNCLVYDSFSNSCIQCKNNYLLYALEQQCLPFPRGASNCEVYASEEVCYICQTGYYLEQGKCRKASLIVQFCLKYSKNGVCQKCQLGYVPVDGKCEEAIAQNCYEYKNQNACSQCDPKDGLAVLVTTDDITNCVQMDLAYCLKADPFYPKKCSQCMPIYYPNEDGECHPAAIVIINCLIYDSQNTCQICEPGYSLTVNKRTCEETMLNRIEPNCEQSYIQKMPDCSICNSNSYFNNDGACVSCPASIQNVGCHVCDPVDTSKCLLCTNGYFMTFSGICIENKYEAQWEQYVEYLGTEISSRREDVMQYITKKYNATLIPESSNVGVVNFYYILGILISILV